MRELTHESAQSMIVEIDRHIDHVEETITDFEQMLGEMKAHRRFLAQFIE